MRLGHPKPRHYTQQSSDTTSDLGLSGLSSVKWEVGSENLTDSPRWGGTLVNHPRAPNTPTSVHYQGAPFTPHLADPFNRCWRCLLLSVAPKGFMGQHHSW